LWAGGRRELQVPSQSLCEYLLMTARSGSGWSNYNGVTWWLTGSASQLVAGLLICFISSMFYAAYSPYIDKNDGRLAQVCQLSLFFVLVSTIALRNDGERSADTLGVLLVVTLFVPPAAAILLHTRSSML
jgi:ABC-type Mn2+/Zn2+ transport system permease subunit